MVHPAGLPTTTAAVQPAPPGYLPAADGCRHPRNPPARLPTEVGRRRPMPRGREIVAYPVAVDGPDLCRCLTSRNASPPAYIVQVLRRPPVQCGWIAASDCARPRRG